VVDKEHKPHTHTYAHTKTHTETHMYLYSSFMVSENTLVSVYHIAQTVMVNTVENGQYLSVHKYHDKHEKEYRI
jgi:hypothetical protein